MARDPSGRYRIIIVGAGIAGIGLAIRLKRAGMEDFVLLESADEVGGVWRDNVYPGVACDIPSPLYSYSFLPKSDWTRLFAPGWEIRRYLSDAVITEGLSPHLRLSTPMLSSRWNRVTESWAVETDRGAIDGQVLVLAAGRQTTPLIPDITGLDRFRGRAFHSSRWDPRPIAGLRVGVVGTGASAVQLLPHVAERAARTVVFQRTPAWVLPREDRLAREEPLGDRDRLATEAEALFEARVHGSAAAARLTTKALEHLRSQVPDTGLQHLLTPDYEIGCKRAVFSNDYYPSLLRPNVTLEPSALVRTGASSATAASGRCYELDILVLATGFDTARQPYAATVTGRHGCTLAAHWAQGPRSYASVAVHGFPNMFVMGGPNAALGHHSALEILEAQMSYILGAVGHLDAHDAPLEVSLQEETAYGDLIDQLAARTVWTQGRCTSWYLDRASGRPSLLWPSRAAEFRRRFSSFEPAPYQRPARPSTS